MNPSTKVRVTAIVGALVAAALQIAQAAGLDVDLPESLVALIVTGIVSVLAYLVPESNPSPSAIDTMRSEGVL